LVVKALEEETAMCEDIDALAIILDEEKFDAY